MTKILVIETCDDCGKTTEYGLELWCDELNVEVSPDEIHEDCPLLDEDDYQALAEQISIERKISKKYCDKCCVSHALHENGCPVEEGKLKA